MAKKILTEREYIFRDNTGSLRRPHQGLHIVIPATLGKSISLDAISYICYSIYYPRSGSPQLQIASYRDNQQWPKATHFRGHLGNRMTSDLEFFVLPERLSPEQFPGTYS